MKRRTVGKRPRLRWSLSCGAVLAVAASSVLPAIVHAQETVQAAPDEQARPFDIPPQALASALTAFARQSGLQVSADAALVRGVSTSGVSGNMAPSRALAALLSGTGLAFRFTDARTVTLEGPGRPAGSGAVVLDPVQVQGYPVPPQAMIDNLPPPYAGGQVATGGQLGLLGDRPVMDTPFNQTSYTAKKAQDQQAKTVRDVLIDDPSVRSRLMDGGPSADAVMVRGFRVGTEDIAYGGLYGMLPLFSIMSELAERVELLKGPSVLLNGMAPSGAIGGTINLVPKRAPDEGLTQLTANYVSAGQVGGHADVARRFGPDNQFGVRFNGVFKAGQTDVQWNTDQRALALLGMDFRGDHVRVSADLGYQFQDIGGVMPFFGVADGVALPWAPNVRNNPGGQPWNAQYRKDLFGVVRGEVDLTDRITAYVAVGAHDNRLEGLYTAVVTVTGPNGAANNDNPLYFSQYNTFLTAETGVRARVDTGPISHEVALTGTTYESTTGSGFVIGPAFATNIYSPTIIARPNLPTPAATKSATQSLSTLGIADTLSAADKRIQLTAGMRLQNVTSGNFDRTSDQQTSGYDQSALSPAVALVFKPWENVSVYGNFIQGLQQGTIVSPPFTNAGEVFPPFQSTQYEAGIKVDWGKFTTTASVFQISQPSLLTNVATNTLYLGGEQVNQGLELNFFGEPVKGVRLLGGAMFLNAVLTQTQGGLTDGWIAPESPAVQLNLAGEWDLPFAPGLTVNGRAIYTGSQYIDTNFPRRSLPQWTRFDLGARYAFENPGAKGKLLVARFNVDNVLDANYWAGGINNGIFLGMPRTFRVSLTADF